MQEGQGETPSAPTEGQAPFEAVRADERYQFEAESAVEPPREQADPFFDGPFWEFVGNVLGFLLRIVFWGGLALLAAFLVYQAVRYARQQLKDRTRKEPVATPAYTPAPAAIRTLLDDADRLAAKGRYGDAVRLLLRRSIEDVARRHPGSVRDSLTSREISRLPVLAPEPRDAFTGIAVLVERAHFAGRPLHEADWEDARARYAQLGAKNAKKEGPGKARLRAKPV